MNARAGPSLAAFLVAAGIALSGCTKIDCGQQPLQALWYLEGSYEALLDGPVPPGFERQIWTEERDAWGSRALDGTDFAAEHNADGAHRVIGVFWDPEPGWPGWHDFSVRSPQIWVEPHYWGDNEIPVAFGRFASGTPGDDVRAAFSDFLAAGGAAMDEFRIEPWAFEDSRSSNPGYGMQPEPDEGNVEYFSYRNPPIDVTALAENHVLNEDHEIAMIGAGFWYVDAEAWTVLVRFDGVTIQEPPGDTGWRVGAAVTDFVRVKAPYGAVQAEIRETAAMVLRHAGLEVEASEVPQPINSKCNPAIRG